MSNQKRSKSSEVKLRNFFRFNRGPIRKFRLENLLVKGILAVIIAALFLNSIGVISAPSASATDSTLIMKRAFFETGNHTDSVIIENSDLYLNHYQVGFKIPSIESSKSSQITLLYRNVRVVKDYSPEFQTFLENNWILKDPYGNLIRNAANPSQYIVDKGSPSYQQWIARWINNYVYQYGYDGVFLDCSVYPTAGENLWGTNAYTTGAINSRTGRLYTDGEHKQAEVALINRIKYTIGAKLVIGNGVYEGERFFQRDYDDILLNSMIDGVVSEGWLMTYNNPYWYSEAKWLENIKFASWLESNFLPRGKIFIPAMQNVEPYDGGGTRLPPGATAEQYALYGFSSLLLAATKSGSTYINFGSYMLREYPQSLFKIDLGVPIGNYYMISGTHVYTRDFTKTKILVNPTYTPYTVYLDGYYRTPEGQTLSSSITMYPHTGLILERLTTLSTATSGPTQSSSTALSDNFESGNFGWWNMQFTTEGESAYVTRISWGAPVYEGYYCARFRTDGQYSIARSYIYKDVDSTASIYASAKINYDSGLLLNKWDALWTIQFLDSTGSVIASYGVKANQDSPKWAVMHGSQTNFGSFGPRQDTWYTIETMFTKSSSGDTLAMYVDGAKVASIVVSSAGEDNVEAVRIGIPYNDAGYTSAIYVDSIIIGYDYI